MNEQEIKEMQQRIDEGIRIAQERLLERARQYGQTLVVERDGQIINLVPDGEHAQGTCLQGDPLHHRNTL